MSNGVGCTELLILRAKNEQIGRIYQADTEISKNDGMSCNFSVIKSYLYYKGDTIPIL